MLIIKIEEFEDIDLYIEIFKKYGITIEKECRDRRMPEKQIREHSIDKIEYTLRGD
jgi:hypothetical protein